MAIRRWLLSGLAVCALTGALWARPGTVKTRDNVAYQGDISEADDGNVIVKVHGIDMRIDRRDVASIEYTDDLIASYKKKLAALPVHDSKSRMDMARAAYNQKQYDLARMAAQSALDADPNSAEATDFLNMIRRQAELDRTKPAEGAAPEVHEGPAREGATPNGKAGEHKVLSADDVNIIKQSELTAQDTNYKAAFKNDVRRKFTEKDGGGTLPQFLQLSVPEQVQRILSRAPEMANDVRIQSDPVAIAVYKKSVQPAILAGCATSSCHGGAQAGKFALVVPADSDAATYTNFYILSQYVKTEGNLQMAMVDRTSPHKSLIVQYALPAETADFDHPNVAGYKGLFHTANDPRYVAIMDWISKTLAPVPPQYKIEYGDLNKQRVAPTSQPAGK